MRLALSFPGAHRRGGIERVVLECASFLQAQGHETHLFASEWDSERLPPAVTTHLVPIPRRGSLLRTFLYARRSRRALRALTPPAHAYAAFGVLSPTGGVMWVPSVHKAWLEASRRQRGLRGRIKQSLNPLHPLLLAMEYHWFARRKYKRLVALTEQVKADLVRLYGVPPADIDILPNGYAPEEFNWARAQEHRAQMRASLGYSANDTVVVFVANELERKGFGPLLRAIAQLNSPHVHLLAVGRLNPQVYAPEIARLGMTGRVQFPGPSGDVALSYAAADVFVLPTQYEAWGLVIVEALACGLPVITSRLAGAARAVREGENGLLLDDPNDVSEIAACLRTVLEGGPRRSEAIAQSVLAYIWPHILAQFEKILLQNADKPNSVS